jgi:hypothetical protein
LQALLSLSLSPVCTATETGSGSVSCSRTRTLGSRSDQRLGALSQLSESHLTVDGLLRRGVDAASATLATLERAGATHHAM